MPSDPNTAEVHDSSGCVFADLGLPVNLAEIARAAVDAHKRASAVLAEPAASQAAGEVIRELVERYRAQ